MSVKVTQTLTEAIVLRDSPPAFVTQTVVEVIIPVVSRSPTTPTGAGVTQALAEIITLPDSSARVTQTVVEVIVVDTSTFGQPGTGPTVQTSYGWAG